MFIQLNNIYAFIQVGVWNHSSTSFLLHPGVCNEKFSNHCQLYLIKLLNFHNVITSEEQIFDDWLFIITGICRAVAVDILAHVEWDNFNQIESLIICSQPSSDL